MRCLLALGCIKLAIMAFALLDLPMPSWRGAGVEATEASQAPQPSMAEQQKEFVGTAEKEIATSIPSRNTANPEIAAEMPQGSAAAELAASARPRRLQPGNSSGLPAPLVTAGPFNPLASEAASYSSPLLPQPAPLGAPLARAGVILPQNAQATPKTDEESIWDMLDIKSLPIPGLGSAQAAHAAAMDMPVPATPQRTSPFTPAEQIAPSGRQPTVLPGAPPLPDNIPHGQAMDGTPLPPRQTGAYSPLPGASTTTNGYNAPAPDITAKAAPLDPNIKTQELARQQQDILMLRQQMDQRLKDLQNAEDKMKGMLREAKDIEDKKIRSLIQMYANMKPRQAAQAVEKMDERIAVRILSGMAPKQSGEILTYTNPAKTAKLTEMITRLRMME